MIKFVGFDGKETQTNMNRNKHYQFDDQTDDQFTGLGEQFDVQFQT